MTDARFVGVGLFIALVGVLGAVGYIPFPSLAPAQQSGLCFQSIVAQSTVCAPSQSYLDNLAFAGTHTLTSNPVYVSQTSGAITAYGFLATGATVSNPQMTYSTPGSSPTTLTITASGVNAQGVYSFTAQTPVMTLGIQYTYQATITDSFGTKSSVVGSVIPSVGSVNFIATVQTLNGTKTIGGLPIPSGVVAAVNVWNTESPYFALTINSNAQQVQSVSVAVTNSAGTVTNYQMPLFTMNTYSSYINFALGSYTVTGTINLAGGASQTAFSVRVTSIPQPVRTVTSITTTPISITVSQTGSTCTPVNGVVTCVSTTTQFTCIGLVCTATSVSGTSTTVTTSTQSTTSICQSVLCPKGFTYNILALATIASGLAVAGVGVFLKRDDDGQ